MILRFNLFLLSFGLLVAPSAGFIIQHALISRSQHAPVSSDFVRITSTCNGQPATKLCAVNRRDALATSLMALPFSFGSKKANAAGGPVGEALADIPMIRLQLPKGGFGRNYVAVPLKINGEGPFDFMIDTGLTTELITPHLQQILHLANDTPTSLKSLTAGGSKAVTSLSELTSVELQVGKDVFHALPAPLHAIVGDFPQEHIDPAHDPVEGMLGMEVLSQLDVDFDFPAGRIRFYPPGTAKSIVGNKGLVPIPAVVFNETGLIGIRLTVPSDKPTQPIVAFIDCGSPFSIVNWQGAKLLGLPDKGNSVYQKYPQIVAMGIDGNPQPLPTLKTALDFAGEVVTNKEGRPVGFGAPPDNWKPWKDASVAVGDLPIFSTVLGDGVRPYEGPAALIGLDVLSQRRVIFEAATKADGASRRRRIWVSPS